MPEWLATLEGYNDRNYSASC